MKIQAINNINIQRPSIQNAARKLNQPTKDTFCLSFGNDKNYGVKARTPYVDECLIRSLSHIEPFTREDAIAQTPRLEHTRKANPQEIQQAKKQMECYKALFSTNFKRWDRENYHRLRGINSTIWENPRLQTTAEKGSYHPCITQTVSKNWIRRALYEGNEIMNGPFLYRASLNVTNDERLLEDLDNLLARNTWTDKNGQERTLDNPTPFKYKFRTETEKWFQREDPITIYFKEQPSAETMDALIHIANKYRNGAIHNAPIEKDKESNKVPLVNNIVFESCPSDSDIDRLIDIAKKYNKGLANHIYEKAKADLPYQKYSLSTGRYESLCEITRTVAIANGDMYEYVKPEFGKY